MIVRWSRNNLISGSRYRFVKAMEFWVKKDNEVSKKPTNTVENNYQSKTLQRN